MPKLTKRFVEGISVDPEKTLKVWDSELKGFGVVILPSGRRTYCIQYRNKNRILKRYKIGVHGQITAEQARDLARVKLGHVAQGEDPLEQKQDYHSLPTGYNSAENYLERHGYKKRPRSLLEDKRFLQNIILPSLGLYL